MLARVAWLRGFPPRAPSSASIARKIIWTCCSPTPPPENRKPCLSEQDKYWINLSDDLHFLGDGKRFLWSSERSGFRHLYLYDLSGKQLAQLTSGDWQVESVAGVDEKNGQVYFTSTQQSPIERQFYRVAITLSGARRPARIPCN